jgi:stage V sporulation protein G
MFRFENSGALKAFADITINDVLVVKGLRVVEGKNGLFVSMPQTQGKDNRWYDSISPVSAEARQAIQDEVLAAYNEEKE